MLSPDEILKLSQTPAPHQPGVSPTAEICRDITEEKVRRRFQILSSKIEPFFQSVLKFWPVIDVLVASKPEVAALVWGSFKFVIIVSSDLISITNVYIFLQEARLLRTNLKSIQ